MNPPSRLSTASFWLFLILAAGCASGEGEAWEDEVTASEEAALVMNAANARDFLIQNVCPDTTHPDPYGCPRATRDLLDGEWLPYHKFDSGGGQVSDSFPRLSHTGVLRGIQTMQNVYDISGKVAFDYWDEAAPGIAPINFAWGVNEFAGPLYGGIGTFENRCGVQDFGPDGWVLFDQKVTGNWSSTVARIGGAQSFTRWRLAPITFTTGAKRMMAIIMV